MDQVNSLITKLVSMFPTKKKELVSMFKSGASVMRGEFLKVAAEKGVEAAASMAFSELSRVWAAPEDLKKLNDTRERIRALLSDAEQRRYIDDDFVILWLSELKAVAFDAEDLDEVYRTRESLFNNNNCNVIDSKKRKWSEVVLPESFRTNSLLADEIKQIRKRYEEINEDRKKLKFRAGEAARRPAATRALPPPEEGSLQDSARIFGRVKESSEIVGLLTSGSGTGGLLAVSINGIAGIGKTALARQIFDNDQVKKFFPKMRIWVGLTLECDVIKATKEIIKAVEEKESHCSSLDRLQCHLKSLVEDKRFLLVLDNVWNEESDFWDKLRAPLIHGAQGSRILITTRSERVSRSMQYVETITLKGLQDGDGWLLFQDRAFDRRAEPGKVLKDNPELETIGKKIVSKCQGLPLVLRSIGGLLYSETDDNEWSCVLEDLPETGALVDNVIPTLKVSYDHLPLHLKHCFAFCSIFPTGYEFDKDQLIKLWMALGFVKPTGRRRLEDVGGKYFSDLLWRSFFQTSDGCERDRQRYKMPSVIHELAQSVSPFECFKMDLQKNQRGETGMARYGMLCQRDIEGRAFEMLLNNMGLRALILHGGDVVHTRSVLSGLFVKLRYLRVLDLSNSEVDELADTVGGLILLRYLSLYGTKIKRLPESVGNLFNLQTLELGKCHLLLELPDSIGDLKDLRYLGLYNTNVKELPESVSSLCNLQTLELSECYQLLWLPKNTSELVNLRQLGLRWDYETRGRGMQLFSMPRGIGKLTNLQMLSRFAVGTQAGCRIGELKDLKLRGELCILKLENVVNVLEAREANLKDKLNIDTLMLHWSDGASSTSQHRGVEDVIEGLRPHDNLKQLWIDNYCGTKFPEWLEHPSFLRLETLRLSECKRCKFLPLVGKFPQLKTLHIEGLDGVKSVSTVIPDDCNSVEFPSLETFVMSSLPHLTKLVIANCPKLRKFEISGVPKLEEFQLRCCESLRCLPCGLNLLTSLQCLEIQTVPLVKSLPALPARLQNFTINGCPMLP